MTSMPRLTAARRAIPLLVVIAVAAACGQASPSASPTGSLPASASPTGSAAPSGGPSGSPAAQVTCPVVPAASQAPVAQASPDPADDPNAARYAEIEGQVSALRGLTLKSPVQRATFTREELGKFIAESFARDNPESLVKGNEAMLKGLLLMPQDQSLRDLYVEMLTSQVAGLYDDTTKKMYVVTDTGVIGPTEEITYAHEYTHALQDQAFTLRSLTGGSIDQGDRTLARTALIEGDATLLMSLWAQQNLTPAELQQAVGAGDPADQALLDALPAMLRETLLFPYLSGLTMNLGAFTTGGGYGGVDNLFANPPDSTEQVLHPDKLNPREAPVPVAIDAGRIGQLGDGWCVALQDTLGEFQLGVMLGDAAGADKSTADAAAAGWGGDRVALVQGPNGASAVVLDTVWDTDADATAYNAALAGMVGKLQAAGRSASALMPAPNRVVLISADSDDTLGKLANALGLAG